MKRWTGRNSDGLIGACIAAVLLSVAYQRNRGWYPNNSCVSAGLCVAVVFAVYWAMSRK